MLTRLLASVIEQKLSTQKSCILAIDGMAGSGKSTLAAELAALYDSSVIHMDHFFLPPQLRKEKRLQEAGGNIHYERFAEEILPHLRRRQSFAYNIFDCHKMQITARAHIKAAALLIVEGSYALHPSFGSYADLSVYLMLTAEEQVRRLILRGETPEKIQAYKQLWIPMEERYAKESKIFERCQYCFDTSSRNEAVIVKQL